MVAGVARRKCEGQKSGPLCLEILSSQAFSQHRIVVSAERSRLYSSYTLHPLCLQSEAAVKLSNRPCQKKGEIMSDDIFDFDIDAALETAEEKAAEKASAIPEILTDEADCEGCKI